MAEIKTREQYVPQISDKSRKMLEKNQSRQQKILDDDHVEEIDGNTVHTRLYQKHHQQNLSPRQRAQISKEAKIG